MAPPRRAFTVIDRTTVALRLRDGWGFRVIVRSLGPYEFRACYLVETRIRMMVIGYEN
jgi:hypothetical protein